MVSVSYTHLDVYKRQYQQDVYFDITIGKPMLGIQSGEGVKGYQFTDEKLNGEDLSLIHISFEKEMCAGNNDT